MNLLTKKIAWKQGDAMPWNLLANFGKLSLRTEKMEVWSLYHWHLNN